MRTSTISFNNIVNGEIRFKDSKGRKVIVEEVGLSSIRIVTEKRNGKDREIIPFSEFYNRVA